MKKLLLPLFSLCFLAMQAQEESDTKAYKRFLSGSISMTLNERDILLSSLNPEFGGSLALTMGFQPSDKLYLGIGPTFSYSKDEGFPFAFNPNPQPISVSTLKEISMKANAFVRYIVGRYSKLDLFVEESIGFQRIQSKIVSDNAIDENKASIINLGVNVGLQYQLIDRLRLTTSFGGLNFSTQRFDGDEWNNRFNASIFSRFAFGGEWLF